MSHVLLGKLLVEVIEGQRLGGRLLDKLAAELLGTHVQTTLQLGKVLLVPLQEMVLELLALLDELVRDDLAQEPDQAGGRLIHLAEGLQQHLVHGVGGRGVRAHLVDHVVGLRDLQHDVDGELNAFTVEGRSL